MKRIAFLLITIIGLFTLFSCETDRDDPVINTSDVVAPAITSPVDGSSFVLLKDSAESNFETITWTAANYGVDNLPDITYTLQMDIADSNFLNIETLQSSTDLEYTTDIGSLNDKLSGMGLIEDIASNVAFRVLASQTSSMEDIYSSVISVSITPYSTVVVGDALYIYGGSTDAGWDNSVGIEMTLVGEDYYATVIPFDATGDGMKFITTLGADIPNWGTDATGTDENGPLFFQATADDPANINIPTTLVSGDHRIEAHTGDSAYYAIFNYPDTMYILGDGTDAGWDNALALIMTKEAPGIFSITANMGGAGLYWKFIGVLGQWAPMFGTDADGTALEGNLSWRPTEDVADPPAIESPEAGTYLIEANLITLRYKCTLQ